MRMAAGNSHFFPGVLTEAKTRTERDRCRTTAPSRSTAAHRNISAGGMTDPAVLEAAERLASTPAGMFLWAALERLGAIILHLSLSVLVFAAVRKPGKTWLFPAAILIHAAIDCIAAVANAYLPVAAVEIIALASSALAALFARTVYRTLPAAARED